ncbi:hypothetical protein XANCAGTX0491_009870 [Xanthoria calcicola]
MERAFNDESSLCLGMAPYYCSKDCQQAHWGIHKGDCKSPMMKATWRPSWIIEAREPAFIGGGEEAPIVDMVSHGKQKYLWGNVPALDLLNLQQNEGFDFTEDLRLLFAGGYSSLKLYQPLIPI